MLLEIRYYPYTYLQMRDIILLVHDIRSCHNVGSLLRTAEGLGVTKVYFSGYTPYPTQLNDTRLPHIHQKLTKQIHKTALGAEKTQEWEYHQNIHDLIRELKEEGYSVVALEQSASSKPLHTFTAPNKVALLCGREVEGLEQELLKQCDITIEIDMFGSKESFNIVQAAAMALYHLRFM